MNMRGCGQGRAPFTWMGATSRLNQSMSLSSCRHTIERTPSSSASLHRAQHCARCLSKARSVHRFRTAGGRATQTSDLQIRSERHAPPHCIRRGGIYCGQRDEGCTQWKGLLVYPVFLLYSSCSADRQAFTHARQTQFTYIHSDAAQSGHTQRHSSATHGSMRLYCVWFAPRTYQGPLVSAGSSQQ